MGKRDKGLPSGANKNEGTGLRPDMPEEKVERDNEMTEKYTTDEDIVADNIPLKHPNRNTDKDEATNAGGYKN
jgi:hypothetical protein